MATIHPNTFIIDGLDRTGKSSLIDNIQKRLGPHMVIRSSVPPIADHLLNTPLPASDTDLGTTPEHKAQAAWQRAYYGNLFRSIRDNKQGKMIFDRLHLSEMVYAPMYRKHNPKSIEQAANSHLGRTRHSNNGAHVRMILLTENFEISNHFVSDGLSHDDARREEEQAKFIQHFNSSHIADKRIICVTAADGSFRPELEILMDALL